MYDDAEASEKKAGQEVCVDFVGYVRSLNPLFTHYQKN